MAKKSTFAKNKRRRELVAKYAERRAELRAIMKSPTASMEEKQAAQAELQAQPRNACPTRVQNRCVLTGRSRGYLRRFGISRIEFRRLALLGQIPGVSKSSW
jgi:small subunit ribosomal protein S14